MRLAITSTLQVIKMQNTSVIHNTILWQLPITKTNNSTISKSLSRISSKYYKKTQQGVSIVFLHYLHKFLMVCANNK